MRVSRIPALLITAMMIPAISGCTTQGSPAPDAVHQIEDDGPAVYDDDPTMKTYGYISQISRSLTRQGRYPRRCGRLVNRGAVRTVRGGEGWYEI